MVLCCNRHGGGYLSLRITLGVGSCRKIGALTEASGTLEDNAVERRHLARSMSVGEERSVLCVLEWQERQRRVDRERGISGRRKPCIRPC